MENINIYDLLPQRPPFVMVDKIVHYDTIITRTELHITKDNIFVNNGTMSEFGLMENIAQTCAARIGYMNRLSGESVKIGVIGAIKGMEITYLPKQGDTIETVIEVIGEAMQMTMVKACITCGGKKIADCEMKIAVTDSEAKD